MLIGISSCERALGRGRNINRHETFRPRRQLGSAAAAQAGGSFAYARGSCWNNDDATSQSLLLRSYIYLDASRCLFPVPADMHVSGTAIQQWIRSP